MKLCMTLLVRDEEDILESHLRFHLSRGVDFVLATDNLSVDRSTAILRRFEREGSARVLLEPDDNYAQAEWVTRMARLAATEHAADWVIHSDADEFWWPEAEDLKAVLSTVPPEIDVVRVGRVNFVPRPESSGPLFDRMVIREAESLNSLGQPLPPKICHRAHPEIRVLQGNHAVEGSGLGGVLDCELLTILHFPLRTYSHFENKIVKGGRAYERNLDLPPAIGATWRRLYELYREGELTDYYASQELTDDEVEEGLASGRLVVDRRLQLCLADLERVGRPSLI